MIFFGPYNMLISLFEIVSFLGGDIASDFILFFFPGMRFSGVALAPITSDKKEISVQNLLSTIISFGDNGYDLLIKFGAFVTFCVLIDYLGIMIFSEIGAKNFSFASFFLSLDDSEPLGSSSSSLTIFSLYLVLLNHCVLKGLP